MIAYVFQRYSEIFVLQLFIILDLPVKIAISLKTSLFLTVFIVFSVYKQNFMAQ